MWTFEQKRDAAIAAPMAGALLRADTCVIERRGWYQLVTPSAPGTLLNEVVCSAVEAEDAERIIDEVLATCRAAGRPVKWCVGPWTRPEDFGERLARRGFRSWDVRGMAIETASALLPVGERSASEDVRVVEVGERELEQHVEIAMRGWALAAEQHAAELATYRAALRIEPRRARFFTALLPDGEPAGTTALVHRGDYAYLVGAQVLAAHRGRGIYRALVAARLGWLADHGVALAVTHAREATSAPILERLGFETVFRSECWQLDAA